MNHKSNISQSFERLVTENKDVIFRLCYKILRVKEDAEDAAQETFIAAFRSFASFRSDSDVRTWLYRIALNKCLDHRKKSGAKKRFSFVQSVFGRKPGELSIKAPEAHSPEHRIEEKERKLLLNSALNQLPEKQRTAILLSKVDGFSQREVSELMGISEGAVESLLSRGKEKLRALLNDYFNGAFGSEGN